MTTIYIPPAGQKRFMIPALICINAKSADEANLQAGDKLIAMNTASTDNTRMFLCENSGTEELERNAEDPHDLSGNPCGVVQAELELLREESRKLREGMAKLHAAASLLAEECNTNADFAAEHDSELKALEDLESVLIEVQDLARA